MEKETIQKLNECLQKIKDLDQKRCCQSAEKGGIYDMSITSWATTAQSLLSDFLEP
jgi:hypothetical protein